MSNIAIRLILLSFTIVLAFFQYSCSKTDNHKIAFTSDRDGQCEIYIMNSDGNEQMRLTYTGGNNPDWSPDGNKIAFNSYGDLKNVDIYVMNADGSEQIRLTQSGGYDPEWSRDGNKIAFTSQRDGDPEIYIMNADGSGQTRLTYEGGVYPDWSPAGNRIVFMNNKEGNRSLFEKTGEEMKLNIYIINVDGTGLLQLTNHGGFYPIWSPDGAKILYYAYTDIEKALYHNAGVYVIDSNNYGRTKLTNEGLFPQWSQTGQRITYVSFDGLHVANADGSGDKLIVDKLESPTDPLFSSDSSMIAFYDKFGPYRVIYTVKVNGHDVKIVASEGNNFNQVWSP